MDAQPTAPRDQGDDRADDRSDVTSDPRLGGGQPDDSADWAAEGGALPEGPATHSVADDPAED